MGCDSCISRFKNSDINLQYAAKDARDFYDFLIKERNFAPDHVQILTDEEATRANILSVLAQTGCLGLPSPMIWS
ncbi:MAG: hypothetical protein R3D26_11590 [Cyanobacteriota/Melainabacteria group bacterium]